MGGPTRRDVLRTVATGGAATAAVAGGASATSAVEPGGTPSGPATVGGPGSEWAEGFEDGSMDGWSAAAPKDPDYAGESKLDNWSVTTDALSGEYSLWLHSEGDRNAVVTDEPVLDMGLDFTLTFAWMSPDPDNRGVTFQLIDPEASDFSSEKFPGVEGGIGFTMGPDAISREGSPYSGNGGFAGGSFERPSLAAGETHTVRVEKRGDRATLYFDGDEMATGGVITSGRYRVMLWSSGTYGTRSSIAFDDFRYAPSSAGTGDGGFPAADQLSGGGTVLPWSAILGGGALAALGLWAHRRHGGTESGDDRLH